jgi:hypothetical protein
VLNLVVYEITTGLGRVNYLFKYIYVSFESTVDGIMA